MVKCINIGLQKDVKPVGFFINKHHLEIKKHTIIFYNAEFADTSAIRPKVAYYTYHRPTYLLAAVKTTTRGIQKRLSLNKSLKTFLESRLETGPKSEKGEDRRSNRSRDNNNNNNNNNNNIKNVILIIIIIILVYYIILSLFLFFYFFIFFI